MRTFSSLVSLSFMLCFVTACSQPVLEDKVSAEFASQDLYRVDNTGFTEVFARRNADLSSYKAVAIQALDVSHIEIPTSFVAGTLRRDWEMTPERESALRAAWSDAMQRVFSSYRQANGGPGVLRIAAKLIKIAPGRPTATTIGAGLQPVGSTQDVMEISAEFRLYDADDDRLLAVIRDNRTLTTVAMSRTAPITVTMLFRSWAASLHTSVSGKWAI